MNTAPLFIGLGGLFLGVLIGNTMVGGGAGKVAQKLADENAAQVVALQDQIAALNGQIAGLENAVAAADAGRTELGARIDGAVSSLSGDIDAVSSSVSALADAGEAETEALQQQLSALGAEVGQIASGAAAAAAATAAAATAAAAAAPAEVTPTEVTPAEVTPAAAAPAEVAPTEATPAAAPPEGTRAGQTVTLLDGKIRAFVSRVDDETGTVRVAINGLSTANLGIYDDLDFDTDEDRCTMKVDALDRGHVQLSAECEPLPPEELAETASAAVVATTAAAAPAAAVAPSAAVAAVAEAESAPDGARAGETLTLLDGAARVFVSGVDEDAGTVRVAVNGQDLATLGGHETVTFPVEGQSCTLNLDALDRGHAQMSTDCVAVEATEVAAAVAISASPEAVASGGDLKGPGQTAWLLEGKARVFVSGVDSDAGTVRVAINGLSTAVLGGPRPVTFETDDATCTLQLDAIVEGRVQLSASCN